MAGGRPPQGAKAVETLQGSRQAKQRLRVILETLEGVRPIASACEQLGIGEAAFHKLRSRWLQDALGSLEPRPRGRPRKETPEEPSVTSELQAEIQRLERELRASQVREELAVAMPALIHRRREEEKKTSAPRRRKRRR